MLPTSSIRGSRRFRLTASQCAAAAHHSRGAACLLVAALVAVAACGSVDSAPLSARNDVGGNGAVGGTGGTTGGAGGVSGEMSVAGAGGNAGGAPAAAGSSGSAGQGGAGAGAGGSSAGMDGAGNHPWTAPACSTSTVGTVCTESNGSPVELTVDGGVPGSGVNSWRCESGCRTPGPNVPCTSTDNHVYCVASCADCRR
jgi:hypothetical protein